MANPAFDRITRKTGDAIASLTKLPLSELNSLLMEIFRVKAKDRSPANVLRDYAANRFVRPSAVDPVSLATADAQLLAIACVQGFEPLILSPLTPLGTCAISGFTDQNKVITALRGTEVVADATNVLALEAAIRRKENGFAGDTVHLCSSHRHVRAQPFPPGKGFSAHFQVFCAISAGKDGGSNFDFEKRAVLKHLDTYRTFLLGHTPFRDVRIAIKAIRQEGSNNTLAPAVFSYIESEFKHDHTTVVFTDVAADQHRYYDRLRFSIDVVHEGLSYNIGDGGFVHWTQALTGNQKERLFISGIGTELIWKLANAKVK